MSVKSKVTTRCCAVCDTLIADNKIVCAEHWKYYLEYQDEAWMIELVDAQRRQYRIDIEEETLRTGRPIRQKRFYRRLTPDDVQTIRHLHSKGIGYVNISRILGINPYGIRSYINRKLKKRSTQ